MTGGPLPRPMASVARRYGYALIDRESREILEVKWTRQDARTARAFREDADQLRVDRVLVRSCVKGPA